MKEPESPVLEERNRIARASRAMDRFCTALSKTCGRPPRDDLTQRIYTAFQKSQRSFDDEEVPAWVPEATRVVRGIYVKRREALDEALRAPNRTTRLEDLQRCRERSRGFFAPYAAPSFDNEDLLSLCLYDVAFLNNKVAVRKAKEEPSSIAKQDLRDQAASINMFATTLQWGVTLLGGLGVWISGAFWLVPLVFTAWLASWILRKGDSPMLKESADPYMLEAQSGCTVGEKRLPPDP